MSSRKLVAISAFTLLLIVFYIYLRNNADNANENGIEVTYLQIPTRLPDQNKLFDLHFEYMINSTPCEGVSEILALIIVTSYFGNVETRSAMRRAFPAEKLQASKLRRVFLLAAAPEDKFTTQEAIFHEQRRFGDLIQGNFNEAYKNLTYKHMMGVHWAATHCKQARYVIKMDDDIVVNLYKTVELLKEIKLPENNILAGYVLRNMSPIREPANKWYVTKVEYKGASYPPFVSGWFYVTNPFTCKQLWQASLQIPYFWVDDVYVTGMLAQKMQLKHYSLKEHFTVHPEILQCCMRDVKKWNYECEVLVGPNGGDNNLFFKFNKIVAKCYYEKCNKRTKPLNQTCVAEKQYPLGKGSGVVENYPLVS